MPDFLVTAARLRDNAGVQPDTLIDTEVLLPRLYPATCVRLPSLRVETLRAWLRRHDVIVPSALATCRDRTLRGGIIAWRGFGLLFADSKDREADIRFTFAHEAHHFLHEHFYPRLDLLNQFGEGLRPVLDGLRLATRAERVDALLARQSLVFHTHLLERETSVSDLAALEADADAFACEMLAPRAVLQSWLETLDNAPDIEARLHALLRNDYSLPDGPALAYARVLLADRTEPAPLLRRLRLI